MSVNLKRTIAFIIDLYITIGITMILFVIVYRGNLFRIFDHFFAYMLCVYGLFCLKDLSFKNLSIRKKIFGLEVLHNNNAKPNKITLIIRNVLCFIWPIEAILVLLKNKKIEDFIFKTIVTNTK